MNNTAKNELKKIAMAKIDRAEREYRVYRDNLEDKAQEYAFKQCGGSDIEADMQYHYRAIKELEREANLQGLRASSGASPSVSYGGRYGGGAKDVAKKHYDEYLSDHLKEVDFPQLREDVITNIYLSDNADEVNGILSGIEDVMKSIHSQE